MPTRSRNWTACLCLRRDPGSRGSLSFLFLDSNNISDITPLSGLTALTSLYLWDNNINDITALFDLTALNLLSLSGNNTIPCADLDGLEAALPSTTISRPTTCASE